MNRRPRSICNFPGCDRLVAGWGYCDPHYRQYRRGQALRPVRHCTKTPDGAPKRWLEDAIASRDRSACWTDWPFAKSGSGYPHMGGHSAGHVALELDGRQRPGEAYMLHGCDDKRCLNPDHLSWGSQKRNVAEALDRQRLPHGGRSPHAKLTPEAVREIRRLAPTQGYARLAEKYGVTRGAVRFAALGQSWKRLD